MQDKVRFHNNVQRIQADRPTVLLIMMNIYPHRDSFAKIYMNKKRFKHVVSLFIFSFGHQFFLSISYLINQELVKQFLEMKLTGFYFLSFWKNWKLGSIAHCIAKLSVDMTALFYLRKNKWMFVFGGMGGNKWGVELRDMIN